MMYVLRRLGRPRREGRLHEAQTVLGVGAVLDYADADRPTAGLLALAGPNYTNTHRAAVQSSVADGVSQRQLIPTSAGAGGYQ